MQTHRLKILLVEDDEDDYFVTQQHLAKVRGRKFQLVWARTYELGLEWLDKDNFTAVLVDYDLGARNGLEFIREANALGNQPPMLLLTGRGSYEIDVEAKQSGAMDYLSKGEASGPLLERSIRYAIERKATEAQLRDAAARSELLATLTHDLVRAGLDVQSVLDTVTRRIAETFGDASLILLSKAGGSRSLLEAYHFPGLILSKETQDLLVRFAHYIYHHSEQAGQQTRNLSQQEWQSWYAAHALVSSRATQEQPTMALPFRYGLLIPLVYRNNERGVLVLVRQGGNPYTQEDQSFFQQLAYRAVLSVENAQLYLEEQRRVRQMEALHQATRSLLETLNLESLIGRILSAAQAAIPAAENWALHLLMPETGQLETHSLARYDDPRIEKISLTKSQEQVAAAVQERRSLRYQDILVEQPGGAIETGGRDAKGVRSMIISPLLLGDEVLGALSLVSSIPGAFQEGDLHLLESFAATTTAAIHNARLHEQVQYLAITDSLTGQYNRRGFFQLGMREVDRFHRYGKPLSMIMLDVDNFKSVNDTYGHAFGDVVLKALTQTCIQHIRKIDILGRYGGDEFVILLPETDLFTAAQVADRIRSCFADRTFNTDDQEVQLTASFGVTKASAEDMTLNTLIEHADEALYASKQKGRNRVEVG